MSDFRQLSDSVWASPQVSAEDIALAGERGFGTVINNRPDGEAEEQPAGEAIEAAAREAGLSYHAIPITHAGFSEAQVEDMVRVLEGAQGPVLAYCRSGTRSTLLWALAQAKRGHDPEAIAGAARQAGYDVTPVRPAMDTLAARSAK